MTTSPFQSLMELADATATVGGNGPAGPWLLASVILGTAAAVAMRSVPSLRTYQFTAWVVVVVVAGMAFPDRFLNVAGVNMQNKWILSGMIQLVMFGMGTQMTIAELASVRRMSYPVAVGVLLQFSVMPLVGYALATVVGLPPEIAAGVVLIGACSSGLASNVMSYIAEANLPLSITLTAIGTVTAPLTTPFWMWLLTGDTMNFDGAEFIKMMLNIVKLVIVPIGAALLHDFLKHASPAQRRTVYGLAGLGGVALLAMASGGWTRLDARWSDGAMAGVTVANFLAGAIVFGVLFHGMCLLLPRLERAMPVASMFGILYVTLITTAAGRDALLGIGPQLFVVSILHNAVGLALGYWICRLTRVDERSSRTIALEVGIQNGGMASGLASEMNKLATVGLAAAVFIPWMNIAGSLLANYWRRRPPVPDPLAADYLQPFHSETNG